MSGTIHSSTRRNRSVTSKLPSVSRPECRRYAATGRASNGQRVLNAINAEVPATTSRRNKPNSEPVGISEKNQKPKGGRKFNAQPIGAPRALYASAHAW